MVVFFSGAARVPGKGKRPWPEFSIAYSLPLTKLTSVVSLVDETRIDRHLLAIDNRLDRVGDIFLGQAVQLADGGFAVVLMDRFVGDNRREGTEILAHVGAFHDGGDAAGGREEGLGGDDAGIGRRAEVEGRPGLSGEIIAVEDRGNRWLASGAGQREHRGARFASGTVAMTAALLNRATPNPIAPA